MWVKRWLLGQPLATSRASEERLSNPVALAIFSSDPLSSVAYATEEILLVLVLAGTAAIHYSIGISLVIVGLVAILAASCLSDGWRRVCRGEIQSRGISRSRRRRGLDD